MTTIQVRDVPEELSRELKARAAAEGRSLSDYVLRQLTELAARPSREELNRRIERLGRKDVTPPAQILAEDRPA